MPTSEKLLNDLRRMANELEKTPTRREMKENGKWSSYHYSKHFGSWNDALKEAGLNTNRGANKKELIEHLIKLSNELDEVPTGEQMNKHGDWCKSTYRAKFGCWNNALKEAGLDVNICRNITKDELINYLHELHDKLDHTPTLADVGSDGKWGTSMYKRKFGSWNNALKEAGLKVNHTNKISKDDLISEIQRLYNKLDKIPSSHDISKHSEYSLQPYINEFTTWNNSLKQAGFEPNNKHDVQKEQLINELKRLSNELNKTPSLKDMREYGKFSCSPYKDKFGSWNNALKEVGLDINVNYNITRDDLINEVKRLSDKLNRTPKQKDMRNKGKWSMNTYRNQFGSWNNALKEAELEINEEYSIPKNQLINHLKKLANELNRTPSLNDMREYGKWSAHPYFNKFGSWNDALEQAGLEINIAHCGEGEYSYGKGYYSEREKCFKRDNYRCRVCYSYQTIHCHHIKPRRTFNNISNSNTQENLITLCASCHSKFEGKWQEDDPNKFADKAKNMLKNKLLS